MNIRHNFNGVIELEGSKSILNRILLLSTFLNKPFQVGSFSSALDIITLSENLQLLGFKITSEKERTVIIPPEVFNEGTKLYIRDSATALRFLLARLAFCPGLKCQIDVSPQLKKRPIQSLIDILKQQSIEFDSQVFPLKFKGGKFTGGRIEIPPSISSQYASALLLSAPALTSDLLLKLSPEQVSSSYIDLTLDILEKFSIQVERTGEELLVKAGQIPKAPALFEVEPDCSSATYFLALGALTEGCVKVSFPADSRQPDFQFSNLLGKMGVQVVFDKGYAFAEKAELKGVEVNMSRMPDQVPTLAVLALFADSATRITGIEHLQYKESNRLQALLQELPKLGAELNYVDGTLFIDPLRKPPAKCKLNTASDHRLVMAFSLLEMIYPQIEVTGKSAVEKSFPQFHSQLKIVADNS